ncbi:IS110 family transposase [Actinopolymorpha pittospori]|uniref:Transposase n=1 Tax=Actinopolymorpha pittospori TaxID=648752 RepID=A0A927MWH5_9ACTN|nr:IS110 family transposase [Actinopolymorpha pittospori]MBE1608196.1 transposase [Actinopolymorpha pittospori]
MPHPEDNRRITIGVDTHADTHVAVALSQLGARLDELHIPTTQTGYDQLERWAVALGQVDAFGLEGTGSYGAELARVLRRRGHRVIEVNRPDRATRHRRGKSDPIDAEMAARAVLSGVAASTPKHADGDAEMLRMLKMAKDSAVKTRTQAINQIKAILVTAPAQLREQLADLAVGKLLERCAAFEPGELTTPTAVAHHTLRLLAQRNLALRAEIKALQADIARLAGRAAPRLLDVFGIGPDGAAQILLTAGDNPRRLRSEAAFAALCGSNPIPASSGKTNRHRLNRGGDRQANATLHRVAVVRLRWHDPSQKYMARRLAEGKSKAEIMRCLKRYIAREIYHILCPTPRRAAATGTDLPQAA